MAAGRGQRRLEPRHRGDACRPRMTTFAFFAQVTQQVEHSTAHAIYKSTGTDVSMPKREAFITDETELSASSAPSWVKSGIMSSGYQHLVCRPECPCALHGTLRDSRRAVGCAAAGREPVWTRTARACLHVGLRLCSASTTPLPATSFPGHNSTAGTTRDASTPQYCVPLSTAAGPARVLPGSSGERTPVPVQFLANSRGVPPVPGDKGPLSIPAYAGGSETPVGSSCGQCRSTCGRLPPPIAP